MALTETKGGDFKDKWFSFVQDGNMEALSAIYYAHFDLLFDYGRKFTSDDFLIEDAIQNVFTNLIRFRERLEYVRTIRSYLMVSFRNELFQQIRRNRKLMWTNRALEVQFAPEYTIEEEIEQEESQLGMNKVLLKSIQKLTSKQQEMLFLRYDAGLSYEEISKALNISVESCRTSVYRAIKGIKTDLRQINHKDFLLLHLFMQKVKTCFQE
ncbi:RNA polymerase sigma factor [Gaoshiqia sp. Z1-71]|uniref:RNA polymerase sigma factor n=1 Tax=Gaoshiqia hydrogeniformans TaxID=3290090 RepID=UPI003BF79D7F